MIPPGRRKSILSLLPLLILLVLTTSAHAASAVLGIDLGTEYFKAAIAKPGSPIDIVLSKDSKRREAATIAFKPSRAQNNDVEAYPERLYGGDAVALAARFPSDVYPNLKSLLGLDVSADAVKTYSARYPGLHIETIPRSSTDGAAGTVGFKSASFGKKDEVFMVEELLAMEFKNIKANAEAAVVKGTFVTDVVITYPPFYTAEEKRAIELAAELAGFRVLGLLSDGLAVGLNYATVRTFDSVSDGAKPEYHLVYDIGAGSATATVLKFQGRTIKSPTKRNQTIQEVIVVSTGYDKTLGGDSLNDLIVTDIITQFLESPKVQKLGLDAETIKSHGKTSARLWKDAERLRQLLSANAVASTSFEGLYDDEINFKYSLTREKFEQLAASHSARIAPPISAALASAGLGLDDLDSIILHGGLVRTPFIQKELEKIAGSSGKLKSNVNADEAAAMGAGFKAAALSPSFRVKDIRDTDISGSPISLKWSSDGKEKSQKIFTASSQTGSEKQVPIKVLEDVKLSFHQSVEEQEISILEVEATNLTKSVAQLKDKYGCGATNISTVFNVRLSTVNGLPEITSGSVSCQTDGNKAAGVIDNVKGLFGFGGKKDGEQNILAEESEADDSISTPLPVSDPTSSASTVTPSTSKDADQPETASSSVSKSSQGAKPTSSTVSIPLALKATKVGLNAPPSASLSKLRGRLDQFDASDRNAALRAEALNTLEAFTYRARDYIEDEAFISASSTKTRDEIEKLITTTSDWLYGEGSDAKLQDFKDRLKALKALVDPVLKRSDESKKRPKAVQDLESSLETLSAMVKNIQGRIELAAQSAAMAASSVAEAATASSSTTSTASSSPGDDLEDDPYSTTSAPAAKETEPVLKVYEYTEEDLSSLTSKYETVKTWLEQKVALQEKLGPYDDPAFLISELETKGQDIQRAVTDMAMKAIRMQQQNSQKTKSSKKPKPKTKKAKSSSGSETASSSSGGGKSSTSTKSSKGSSSTGSSTRVKDEL